MDSSGEFDSVNNVANVATTDHVVEVTYDSEVIHHSYLLFVLPSDKPGSSLIIEKLTGA